MSRLEPMQICLAPRAIGTYFHAVRAGDTVYVLEQIPLDPVTMEAVDGHIGQQITQVFVNLRTIAEAAGGSLTDVVKPTVYSVDLAHFWAVNDVMENFFEAPYPVRAAVGVSQLPKSVGVEIDAILMVGSP